MIAIYNKELRAYFNSASGYIFMGIFLFLAGMFFTGFNIIARSAEYNEVLSSFMFIFLLLVPVLTMKIIADETKTRTDQLLLTSPISITKIVIGKYLAAVTLFLITLVITALYPLVLSMFGPVAAFEVLTGYIGFFLMGASFISIGVFISSLTENQVAAGVGTLGAVLCIWLMSIIQNMLPVTRNSGIMFAIILAVLIGLFVYLNTKNLYVAAGTAVIGLLAILAVYLTRKEFFEGFTIRFFGWFSLLDRYTAFSMGILTLNSIIYYISFSFIFVFLTIRVIEKRRWS
jgi:ABC-2 type transport system permease protein